MPSTDDPRVYALDNARELQLEIRTIFKKIYAREPSRKPKALLELYEMLNTNSPDSGLFFPSTATLLRM